MVPIKYTAAGTSAPSSAEGKAFTLKVTDNRGVYRGQIGAKVNGFGQEMAAIRSERPVSEIIYDALQSELKLRNIVIDDRQARSVVVSITAMHNNFKIGFASGTARGIVTLVVKVVGADGGGLFDGVISEINEVENIMLATGPNAAAAVEGALSKAIRSLFDNPKFIEALVKA